MKSAICMMILLAGAAGCDRAENKTVDTTHASDVSADNTKKNERDRDPSELTPGDQGDNPADMAITQKIRQEVVKDDVLSMTAKNVKIITVSGVVTLRGPVKSDKEKTDIAALAQRVEGVNMVNNRLEVAAN